MNPDPFRNPHYPDGAPEGFIPAHQSIPERLRLVRCEPCQVSWIGSDPCFICGEHRPPTKPTYHYYAAYYTYTEEMPLL